MPTLVFLPHPRLVWVARLPDDSPPLAELARQVEAGAWQPPAAWLGWLGRHFVLPEPLPLCACVQDHLLVVAPDPPLAEKRHGAAEACITRIPGADQRAPDPAQRVVLLRLASGMSIAEIARQLGHSTRWVHYQLRAVRKARAALLRRERRKGK